MTRLITFSPLKLFLNLFLITDKSVGGCVAGINPGVSHFLAGCARSKKTESIVQILCRALGGKTGRAIKGWDIGVKCIHPLPSKNLFSCLQLPSHVTVIKCHQDEVLELPPKAELLARSDKTKFEMFRYGEHILGIQGHPEYNLDILLNLLDRMLQCGYIENEEVDAAKARLGTREPNREAWKRLCSSFLRGKLLS